MSFVEDQLNKYKGGSFEDYYVLLEIEHAKKQIEYAIASGKKYIGWVYCYEDYDSYLYDAATKLDHYDKDILYAECIKRSSIDFRRWNGIRDFLENYKPDEMKDIDFPVKGNENVDFDRIRIGLDKGLRELGCKEVFLFMGPYEKTVEKARYEKGLLGRKKIVPYNETVLEYKWMVYISW